MQPSQQVFQFLDLTTVNRKGVLKKLQKINFKQYIALNFNGQEKVALEALRKLVKDEVGTVYDITLQKIFNNLIISSQITNVSTGKSLLTNLIASNGNLKFYSNSYK